MTYYVSSGTLNLTKPKPSQMAKVPNGIETLPNISIASVGRTNVTETKQRRTDGRRHTRSLIKLRQHIHYFTSYDNIVNFYM